MAINLKKIFLSLFLTAVLMLPYLGSFSHLFEDHDHKTCEISETHYMSLNWIVTYWIINLLLA